MNEWTIKSTMEDSQMNTISRLDLLKNINKSNTITLNNKVLDSINTNEEYYLQYLKLDTTSWARDIFHFKSGKEHYRFLIYMSLHFNGCDIFELGTYGGESALAMSSNPSNQIYTFDIVKTYSQELSKNKNNIHFHIEDIMEHPEHHEKLLSSSFIFLDTVHDGKTEKRFYDFLITNNYKGILCMDDVCHTSYPELHSVWNNIETSKIDVTKYGHETGTGLVIFNNEIEFKLE